MYKIVCEDFHMDKPFVTHAEAPIMEGLNPEDAIKRSVELALTRAVHFKIDTAILYTDHSMVAVDKRAALKAYVEKI